MISLKEAHLRAVQIIQIDYTAQVAGVTKSAQQHADEIGLAPRAHLFKNTLHSKLGYLSPMEFDALAMLA